MNKNFGGRPAGAQNKITKDMRDNLKLIFDNELSLLSDKLELLDTKDRISFFVSILPYMISKMPTETVITETQPLRFKFDTVDICERINDEIVVTNSYKINK